MKNTHGLMQKTLLALVTLAFACTALAASREEEEDDKQKRCKKPKFYDYTPQHMAEVPPQSELSFKVARAKSPEYVHLTVKQIPVALTAENNELFVLMKGKLPAELHGTFARINVRAEGDGGCHVEDGWLIKISE